MQRRKFIALLGGAAAWPLSTNAETRTIGFLSSRSVRDSAKVVAAFGKGLGEVGITDGKDLTIDYLFADGALDRLPKWGQSLLSGLSPSSAVGGSNSAMAAKRASSTCLRLRYRW
jgi:putative ABC transport system substrate-binding protein